MPGKRQHYVPDFMLRRFAVDPTAKTKRLHRLDKASGKAELRSTINEAVIGHYYRIVLEDGTVVDEADKALDTIEDMASRVIRKLDDIDYSASSEDRYILMLFIASLQNRTPQAREALRVVSERGAEINAETQLSDRDAYHKRAANEDKSEEEVEAERQHLLKLFRDGRIRAEALPEHEIGLMFIALEHITNTIFANLGVTCLRIPADSKRTFILSDHPVSHYDEKAPTPEAGISFMSSDVAVTWVPLDPKFGLVLVPDPSGSWQDTEADDSDIDEFNLLTYAWARDAIYGSSQEAVTETRSYAKKHRQKLGEFHYRAPRLWISREGKPGGGPTTFESTYRGQTVKRTVWVNDDEFKKVA